MNHTMAYGAPSALTYHTAYRWRHSAANGDQIVQWTVATFVHTIRVPFFLPERRLVLSKR